MPGIGYTSKIILMYGTSLTRLICIDTCETGVMMSGDTVVKCVITNILADAAEQ